MYALGRIGGTCVLLEQWLERSLLYLPCRHHIYEIILRSVFNHKFGSTSGPNVPLFQRFQSAWPKLNLNNFKPGLEGTEVSQRLNNSSECILKFCMTELTKIQCREDYREFLELTVIFLNGTPARGIFFRVPGAIHHARWMSKAIYCLKIFLLRQEYKLNKREYDSVRDICIFIVRCYVKAWFNAPNACFTPRQDFKFLRDLYDYKTIDKKLSEVTQKKCIDHLWYLSPELVGFAFFDDEISDDTKIKMVQALKNDNDVDGEIPSFINKTVESFISDKTLNLFKRFNINYNFIETSPSTWENNLEYKWGKEIISKLKIVNDTAERAVKLIEDFNKIGSKNEEQKQYILQVVTEYRQRYSN